MLDACTACSLECAAAAFGDVLSLTCMQSADLDALRNQLSIVPQEPAMFSGTLRENIDPFVRYSDAAVAKAVHECGLEGRSLDAVVGVSGENFSLGEKQLVCLSPGLCGAPATAPALSARSRSRHDAYRFAWRVCCSSSPLCWPSTRLLRLWTKRPKCCFSGYWRRSSKKPPSFALHTVWKPCAGAGRASRWALASCCPSATSILRALRRVIELRCGLKAR